MSPEIGRTVCILGLGYIGLPTAGMLATKGYRVLGVDKNPAIVKMLKRGELHVHEPDLDMLVKSGLLSGRMQASTEPGPADVFMICVPTPVSDKTPDLSFVRAATEAIAPHLRAGNLVILESTSPVGTTEQVAAWLAALRADLDFGGTTVHEGPDRRVYVAYCPERVLPGCILLELVENDRIVGGTDAAATAAAVAFYRTFVSGQVLPTGSRTAEMTKLTENSFRDVNIAFANELSLICDKFGVDVWELIELANCHPRVKILKPGPGVGGHCIAVDPWFIVHGAPDEARLIRTARSVNDGKPDRVLEKVRAAVAGRSFPTIACLGLTFKADVDDLRESPALHIVERIVDEGLGKVLAVEPHIRALPNAFDGNDGIILTTAEAAVREADLVLLLVDHRAFRSIDRKLLDGKTVIDTRGLWHGRATA